MIEIVAGLVGCVTALLVWTIGREMIDYMEVGRW
jgi:hypothetical protein